MANFSASQFNAQVRAAQRKAEQQYKREVDRVNRANQKSVDDYNRKVAAHNKREIDRVNRANQKSVDDYNRKVARQATGCRGQQPASGQRHEPQAPAVNAYGPVHRA